MEDLRGRFVLPDLHGQLEMTERMLEKWVPQTHQLIQLGDMIDRGPDSLGVVRLFKRLVEEGKASVVRGNHEGLFLEFLKDPVNEGPFYLSSGGRKTVDSFLGGMTSQTKTPVYIAEALLADFPEEIAFIESLPLYHTWGEWVFVHSGVNLVYKDWKNSSELDFTAMDYKRFLGDKNESQYKFAVGHTHTWRLHGKGCNEPWVSECGTKFFLDGNAVGDGQLNALIVNKGGYSFDEVCR